VDAFVRIQKSGSTSLRKSFMGNQTIRVLDHAYNYDVQCDDLDIENNIVNKKIFRRFNSNDYNKIYALVRNPFNILVSYYFHSHDGYSIDGWCFSNVIHNLKSWREFLDYYLDESNNWHIPPMKKSLFSFARNTTQELIINDYFKIEESDKLNDFIISKNGTPLKTLNKTKNKPNVDLSKFYTKTDVYKLNKIWERDLDEFNYSFR
jgi:hypothetical protein